MNTEKFKGVFPAFYACYDDNGEISAERTQLLAKHLMEKGVKGLYVGGSSGECIYQSVEDRKKILENVMKAVKGKLTIIAHVACNNTKDSCELAAHAESQGVDAIAAIPPIYFHLPEYAIAELKDEIKNMPLGLDTIVGEGGQNISGGQKQRLAIARAMINEKEVIIFDEATSNLDQITEKKIYENLKATNKTQIIITHRLSSIRDVDQIYVLNKGKVIERGTHESLMKKQGWYYDSVR